MSATIAATHRLWRRFARSSVSVVGAGLVALVVLLAAVGPLVTPYPQHVGAFVDFANASQPPSLAHPFGTDLVGRDLMTRVMAGIRLSLLLAIVVLGLALPPGMAIGLAAGYRRGLVAEALMRTTDVFLAVPPLVLALAIMGFLEPTLTNAMIAVAAMWWPWYARITYSLARSLSEEPFVKAAVVVGAPGWHILFREILPNCLPTILTKATLDIGFVILIASSLSFLGLGVQPPTPDLGSMVAEGARYLPDYWWFPLFPGLAIMVTVLGFNLLGDGMRDVLEGVA
jgi:peptide/nickel transport system permease protein